MMNLTRADKALTSKATLSHEAAALLMRDYDYSPDNKPYSPFEWPSEIRSGLTVIVGPSGSGKSVLARSVGGVSIATAKPKESVIDLIGLQTEFLHAAGFSSVPQWCKAVSELSNGEQSRFELARILRALSVAKTTIVFDEFTSVVSREVAMSMCVSLTKFLKRNPLGPNRHLILATCHSDVMEWLSPDTIIDTTTATYRKGDEPIPKPWSLDISGEVIKLWN